jgi:hypothetical protein
MLIFGGGCRIAGLFLTVLSAGGVEGGVWSKRND